MATTDFGLIPGPTNIARNNPFKQDELEGIKDTVSSWLPDRIRANIVLKEDETFTEDSDFKAKYLQDTYIGVDSFTRLVATITNAQLFSVVGDANVANTETMFLTSATDASNELFMVLGNGDDGESIVFNPEDGLMYHASGNGAVNDPDGIWFEKINLKAKSFAQVPYSGFTGFDEIAGMVYAGNGVFLAADISDNFLSITTTGVVTSLGTVSGGGKMRGLAFIGSKFYGASGADALLRILNPLDGSTISSVTITLPGFVVDGVNGMTNHKGQLFAILKLDGGGKFDRGLAIITPTGAATFIGIIGDGFATIESAPFQTRVPKESKRTRPLKVTS